MGVEGLRSGWEALSAEVAEELVAWREAHPRATLAEIEQAVLEVAGRLQARYLEDLVHTSPAAEVSRGGPEERQRCPECGGALEGRGRQERQVLTPRQRTPLRLQRRYGVCTACGSGLFPPG